LVPVHTFRVRSQITVKLALTGPCSYALQPFTNHSKSSTKADLLIHTKTNTNNCFGTSDAFTKEKVDNNLIGISAIAPRF
jgi:hypothetical protein